MGILYSIAASNQFTVRILQDYKNDSSGFSHSSAQ